ncbi:hypothetical protein FD754_000927 [Muntiacus muntjak]|uniref:Pentraxin (PTX) domain-containing protein n=1 Tax=Muntiacus muntjak TaxID=9888 RepID=A0A5N3W584_MUNMU|nr:hypothetical protein FD754_000927 [Muntiacus muntjak]
MYAQEWDCWVIQWFYFQFFKELPYGKPVIYSRVLLHPSVLASASHYWPLENVDGIHELQETTGASRTHNLTVLPSHNSTFVYTNDSAYSNFSATVDIVEGKVNKGIYLKEGKGVTFLYYRKNKTSCISNPAQCGPEGVSFSFFWKTQGEQSTSIPSAYGGQVISNGFKVCSSGGKGSVELYTHNKSVTWEASFSPPGHYWTHVLFTWKSEEGLKVYVNGTLRTSDPSGKASPAYGESNDNLVLESKQDQAKSYENRAFDEFIIWERALTPDEIAMYFTAAIGEQLSLSSISPSFSVTPTVNTMMPTDAYHPIITNLTEERKNFRSPGIVLSYLQNMSLSLPNKSLSEETAFNLTKTFLNTVGEVLRLPSWTAVSEDSAVVPGLIDTIDTVMSHITYNLQASKPQVAIVGSSSMADFSVAKVLPKTMNSSHYRFPAQGQNYIEIPHEAFHSQAWTTIVGLLYHSVHYYLSNIQPANTKIAEAANYKNCLLSATSYLISLEVSPTPKLSQNLSGSPLITVHLRHHLTVTARIFYFVPFYTSFPFSCCQRMFKLLHSCTHLTSMTNLDSILKSRDITLLTKVCLVKAMVFPVVMYGLCFTLLRILHHHPSPELSSCMQRISRVLCSPGLACAFVGKLSWTPFGTIYSFLLMPGIELWLRKYFSSVLICVICVYLCGSSFYGEDSWWMLGGGLSRGCSMHTDTHAYTHTPVHTLTYKLTHNHTVLLKILFYIGIQLINNVTASDGQQRDSAMHIHGPCSDHHSVFLLHIPYSPNHQTVIKPSNILTHPLADATRPTRLLCPWDFPGKNTGMSYHFLLQGVFPTQGSNPHLLRLQ